MPAVVCDTSAIVTASAEMNDLLHAGALCAVHKVFALLQHVDGVAGRHENAIDAV